MELENVLYIVVVVLYFLYTAYQKANKKKSQPGSLPKEKSKGSSMLEELMMEFDPKDKMVSYEPEESLEVEVEPEMKQSNIEERASMMNSLQTGIPNPVHGTAKRKRIPEPPVAENDGNDEIYDADGREFDLRQAIIHNAVLIRPYG